MHRLSRSQGGVLSTTAIPVASPSHTPSLQQTSTNNMQALAEACRPLQGAQGWGSIDDLPCACLACRLAFIAALNVTVHPKGGSSMSLPPRSATLVVLCEMASLPKACCREKIGP